MLAILRKTGYSCHRETLTVHGESKKHATLVLGITLASVDRFSQET